VIGSANEERTRMNTARLLVLAAAAALAAGAVHAQSGAEVLKARGCVNCHDTDKKKVGPAYRDVAAKYRDKKGAAADLVAKIRDGKGHPKIGATEAELKSAVEHVLSTK
jgi:cytochrome c